jgi:hypothetical protein
MADLGAKNERWLTAGELIAHLAQYPADMAVTVSTPDGGWWLNVIGASDPTETDESSVILITRDDFDTRQW